MAERIPKLSVIIPVYNDEANMVRRLRNAAEAFAEDAEIICVDDGSTDNTLGILAEYAARDHRMKIVSKAHAGEHSGFNAGLACAQGDYVYFLCENCVVKAEVFGKLIEEPELSEQDVFLFEADWLFDERKKRKKTPAEDKRRRSHEYLAPGKMLFADLVSDGDYHSCVQSAVFRRMFLLDNKLQFDEGDALADELFMFKAMLLAASASYTNTVGCCIKKAEEPDIVKDFKMHFACYREMMAFVLGQHYEGEICSGVCKRIEHIKAEAFRQYLKMTVQERQKTHWREDAFSRMLLKEFEEWRYLPKCLRMPIVRFKETGLYPWAHSLHKELKYFKKHGLKLTIRKYIKAYKRINEEKAKARRNG